jgi:hypothetical protein
MPWRQVTKYAFLWNGGANRFEIHFWLTPGAQNPNVPDHRFVNLEAAQFAALSDMLRSDVDRKLFCDSVTNQLSSGIDQV